MTTPIATADLVALLAAIPLAAAGGEWFLQGVLRLSTWLRLPKVLVATTLAAFATSSPELTVSSMAALSGHPAIGLGDALGSNVVNLALILGLALLLGPLPTDGTKLHRDIALALAAPLLTLWFTNDNQLSQREGATLLLLFAGWLALLLRQGKQYRHETPVTAEPRGRLPAAWFLTLAGLACLVAAGHLFIDGASGIASAIGVHDYLIGATIVAIGTSLPELMTTLLSRWRGHDDVGLGTLLGSNLFNGLAIVGIAASLRPIQVPQTEVAVALLFGLWSVMLIIPLNGKISRRRGYLLLASYVVYVAITVLGPTG